MFLSVFFSERAKCHTPLSPMSSFVNVFVPYSRNDSQFPSGLCLNCYFSLGDNSKGENTKNKNLGPRLLLLPEGEKFDAELRRVTRSSSDSICQCRICVVGRLNGLEWRRFVAKFRNEQNPKTSTVVKYDRLCKTCFAPIYRGSKHTETMCRSKKQSLNNASLAIADSNTLPVKH